MESKRRSLLLSFDAFLNAMIYLCFSYLLPLRICNFSPISRKFHLNWIGHNDDRIEFNCLCHAFHQDFPGRAEIRYC